MANPLVAGYIGMGHILISNHHQQITAQLHSTSQLLPTCSHRQRITRHALEKLQLTLVRIK
jgi:hypothetical protein